MKVPRSVHPSPNPLPQGEGAFPSPPPLEGGGRGEGSSAESSTTEKIRLLNHARTMRQVPTPAERRLWRALRNRQLHGLRFRRQAPIGPFIVDFFCPECCLIVEVDGATHADPAADASRDAWLRSRGLRLVRFWNNDVMGNMEGVLHRIAEACSASAPTPPPTPSLKGRGSSFLAPSP